MIKHLRTFKHEELDVLDSRSHVIETSTGWVEYSDRGEGPAALIAHGIFGGFDQGLASVLFLKDYKTRFIAPSRFGYLRTPMPVDVDGSPQSQAIAYAALLDDLAIDKVWLIGFSAGGMSARNLLAS